MKHILKRFNFGVFDYKDAEKLLNQMADKGYRFLGDGNFIFEDFAMFEKDEKARGMKYKVDVRCDLAQSEKEKYYDFYKDLGWENTGCHRKKLHIFIADKNNKFPLYTDEFSEMENLNEAIKKDAGIIKNTLTLICAVLALLLMIKLASFGIVLGIYVIIIYLALISIYKSIEIINNFVFTLGYKKCMENGSPIPDNKVLRELKFWSNIFNVISITALASIPILGYSYEIWGAGLYSPDPFGKSLEIVFLAISVISLILILVLSYMFLLNPKKEKFRSAYVITYFISYYGFLMMLYWYLGHMGDYYRY